MRKVSKETAATLEKLTEGIRRVGGHRKIDNAPGTFMRVSVECIGRCNAGLIFSVAHYGEQNGDLMRDPEMTFLRSADGDYYPLSYRNDFAGFDQEAVIFSEAGEPYKYYAAIQHEQAVFAADWMRNICQQQGL